MKMKVFYLKKILSKSYYLLFVLLFTNCKKDFDNEFLPESTTQGLSVNNSRFLKSQLLASIDLSGVNSQSHYVVNDLPLGFVKDGSIDYTSILQAAIIKYPNIVFPNFPILINDTGLKIPSDRTITFLEGSELRMKPSSKPEYSMLSIRSVTNVTLANPVLVGDRYKHTGTTGEWGMGISIYGGSNIIILNPKAREMWGDGIYLGVEHGVIPRNITIKNAVVEYNRRDGMTITAVDGLNLESPYAAFSNGTKPMAGIVFEPDNNKEEIKNVMITDPRTEENAGTGMFVDFGNLMGGGQKKVDVTIINHVDVGSLRGAMVQSRESDGSSTIQGDLKFINPSWSKNAETAIYTSLFGVDDVHIIIENPLIRNMNNYLLTKDETISYLKSHGRINSWAWREVTFSTNWPNLSTNSELAPVAAPIIAPVALTDGVVFAVNAGGPAFQASNGITYQADKGFSGGSIYKTSNLISNTIDGVLYQSERYGNFSYAFPVANGSYEITFKLAEIFHSESGRRQFDIWMEAGSEAYSNVDIFRSVGKNAAYDLVKIVSVTDGVLNIQFRTDIDNAKISAFHVIKR